MKSGGLFAGYGGLDMAIAEVFGAEPAWFSEYEPPTKQNPNPAQGAAKILAHHWPCVPNHGDITQIDWDKVEPVGILGGGFPCQDVSLGGKRAGMKPGTRSGLWSHFALGISKLRPQYVVIENVRGLLSAEAHSDVEPCPWCLGNGPGEPPLRALGAVLGDLGELGYDAQWCGLRAADVGAPHGRFRTFVLAADTSSLGHQWSRPARNGWHGSQDNGEPPADAHRDGLAQLLGQQPRQCDPDGCRCADRTRSPNESSAPAPYTQGDRWDEGRTEPAWELRGSDASERGAGAAAWGQYGPAIERWRRILGRVAPAPTEPNAKGNQRLSPAFVEWMMGLPAGHVTTVPGVNRNAQLKALGNGVVPQQAMAALRHMYAAERREVA